MIGDPRTRKAWDAAKRRCYSRSSVQFANYGGRGITMCDRWRGSFNAFLTDMGLCPDGLTLERTDVNGNYEPSNCCWASWIVQQNNRRNNRVVTFGGQSHTVAEWATVLGVNPKAIYSRVHRGWSDERIIGSPFRQFTALTHNGRTQTMEAWAAELGVDPTTLLGRIRRGWPMEKALAHGAYAWCITPRH